MVLTPGPDGRSLLPVDALLNRTFVLPNGGKVKIIEFIPNFRDPEKKTGPVVNPALKFEVTQEGETNQYLLLASHNGS